MNTEDLLNLYTESSFIKSLSNKLDSISNINGFSGSQIAFIAAAVYDLNSCDHFFIFQNKESALLFKNDFEIISQKMALIFTTNKEKINSSKEITQNTRSLFEINSDKKHILISFKDAVNQKTPNNSNFQSKVLNIKIGDKINADIFIENLYENNFENVEFVTSPGEFSIRGYIIDIFSFSNNVPYRIVLTNDTIESITIFEIETQLSMF